MNLSFVMPVVAALSRNDDAVAGVMAAVAGFYLFMMLLVLAMYAFLAFCFWRVFTKTGHGGPLGLLVLVPGFGFLIVTLILAFSEWPAQRAQPVVSNSLTT